MCNSLNDSNVCRYKPTSGALHNTSTIQPIPLQTISNDFKLPTSALKTRHSNIFNGLISASFVYFRTFWVQTVVFSRNQTGIVRVKVRNADNWTTTTAQFKTFLQQSCSIGKRRDLFVDEKWRKLFFTFFLYEILNLNCYDFCTLFHLPPQQCGQIGRFIGLWATNLWPLATINLPRISQVFRQFL